MIMEANGNNPNVTTATKTVAGKETVGAGAGAGVPFRWNPTKEQINMLENLYKQGVRTPSAEQIQDITTRLQTYGHIEGKNVFYWFQNHKARQRQKEKQDHLSNYYFHHQYYNLHQQQPPTTTTIFPMAHHPNVLYGQYCCMPQNDLGFYTHYQKVLLPNTTNIKRRSHRNSKPKLSTDAGTFTGDNSPVKSKMVNERKYTHQETLDLFPLHPTGILEQKEAATIDISLFKCL